MAPVVVDYEYHGIVVKGVKALKCPVCGDEVIEVEEKVNRLIADGIPK